VTPDVAEANVALHGNEVLPVVGAQCQCGVPGADAVQDRPREGPQGLRHVDHKALLRRRDGRDRRSGDEARGHHFVV
jgi:hypothetical protein